MKFRFFSVNALEPGVGEEEVNRFCASHKLVSIQKQFVVNGPASYWALCIQYLEGPERSAMIKKDKIDYREVLSETDFNIYSKLRALRKSLSEKEGIPLYSIFTNEQLAAMVQNRTLTETDLSHIEGVGKARLEKYGVTFISILQKEFAKDSGL